MDSRTRPAHAALNGKVFRYDDPFWTTGAGTFRGYNCRCRMTALDDQDLKEQKLTPEEGAGRIVHQDVMVGDNIQSRTGYVDPKDGTTLWTDVGFGNDRSKTWMPDPANYPMELRPILKDITDEAGIVMQTRLDKIALKISQNIEKADVQQLAAILDILRKATPTEAVIAAIVAAERRQAELQ
jgi:hypothetical protein